MQAKVFLKKHWIQRHKINNGPLFGMSQPSYMSMGWSIAFADVNNNGFEDIIVANGHLQDFIKKIDSRQSYAQPNQLILNQEGKKFLLQQNDKTFSTQDPKASRGLAIADWNNDGKIDFAVNNIVDKFEIFKYTDKNSNSWLGIQLNGSKQNSSAIEAVVTIKTNDTSQRKEVISGGSYMSQSELRLVFGLGDFKEPIDLHIKWPDGKASHHSIKEINKYHVLNYPNRN